MKKAEIKKQVMAKAKGQQAKNFGKAVDEASPSNLKRVVNWLKSGDANKRFWDAVRGKAYGKDKEAVEVAKEAKPEVKPTVLHSKYN